MNDQDLTLPSIDMVSDHACLITFAEVISDTTANDISTVTGGLKATPGVIDLVPSYTTLLVVFDTDHFDRFAICTRIRQILEQQSHHQNQPKETREVVIPVYYDDEVGPDIEDVAEQCQISIDEVIALHSQTTYRAYAIGFTPGFAFLGNTPTALHVPRKATPRLKVPTGSVAIAEQQTAVYPSVTPGGWQIIGRTPLQLVDWGSESLALIEVGDSVRFTPISRTEFIALGGKLDGV